VKQIRRHVTYANVMSSLAVFLILGGATAFAAKKIGANQLKANSVKTGKIVKGAVTASKLKKNAVTTAKIANDAVTGEKVNEATLGTVPSAQSAASFAGTTQQIVKYRAAVGSGPTVIFAGGGLTITAACNGVAPKVGVFTASTDTNDSSIWSSGFGSANDTDFDVGDSQNIAATGFNDAYSIVYQRGLDGPIVTAEIGIRNFDNTTAPNTAGNSACQAVGRVLVG
jgi:hypothetical protein